MGYASSNASPPPSFAGARLYETVGFTYSLAIGDLNGDGKPDLATANYHQYFPSVSVLLNRGDGGFRAAVDYEAGSEPYSAPAAIALGDLNGDGKLDLATANGDTVSVLLNRGNGRFRPKRNVPTGGARSIAVADLNADGSVDLATANDQANAVSVLLNRGDGSFLQVERDYRTGRAPSSIRAADLNGDGKPDVATANTGANTVSVLMNAGDGSFEARRDYRTGRGPSSVAIGDLNGDGRDDLATANAGANTVSVRLNMGGGSFQARRDFRAGRGPSSVAIGDLNGDGKPELVAASGPTLSVLTNGGDGSFQAPRGFRVYVGYFAGSVAIGDLNADGKPDLASATLGFRPQFDSGVSVLANATGLCGVPDVRWTMTVRAATATIAWADCRVGRVRRAYSRYVRRGRVISQKPMPGALLPKAGTVNLVVSRGRR